MLVLVQRGVHATLGLITLYLVTRYLNASEQGFYYVISTIVGIMLALDLGLTNVLVPLISKYRSTDISTSDSSGNIALSIASYGIVWYLITGLLILALAPCGFAFLNLRAEADTQNLKVAWYLTIAANAAIHMLSPFLLTLEGMGKIKEVYILKIIQSLVGAATLWVALVFGAGILATPIAPTAIFACTVLWLCARHSDFIKKTITSKPINNWRKIIWPIQWRTGANIFLGYVLIFIYTPIYYLNFGAEAAGKIGITMACVNTLYVLSASGVVGNISNFARLIADGEATKAKDLFKIQTKKSEKIYITLAVIFLTATVVFRTEELVQRFVSPGQLGFILFGVCFYLKACEKAYYMRASLTDVTLGTNLITLISVLIFGYILTIWLNEWAYPISLFIVFVFILSPLTNYLSDNVMKVSIKN